MLLLLPGLFSYFYLLTPFTCLFSKILHSRPEIAFAVKKDVNYNNLILVPAESVYDLPSCAYAYKLCSQSLNVNFSQFVLLIYVQACVCVCVCVGGGGGGVLLSERVRVRV